MVGDWGASTTEVDRSKRWAGGRTAEMSIDPPVNGRDVTLLALLPANLALSVKKNLKCGKPRLFLHVRQLPGAVWPGGRAVCDKPIQAGF